MIATEELRRRIRGAEDLRAITRAMKALAAVRIRQSREVVALLEHYARAVELGLQAALRDRPARSHIAPDPQVGRTGAVIFGSDLGLAGRFNVRIADFACERLATLDPPAREEEIDLIAVGGRLAARLEASGRTIRVRFRAADSTDAIATTVQDLLLTIEALRVERHLGRVLVFYNHYRSGARYRPHMIHLLPPNPEWLEGLAQRSWPGPVRPIHRTEWPPLFSALVREHLFVSLVAAAAESHAAENASRLASMEAAGRRIDERLADLRGRFGDAVKQRITEELLDLMTGFTAVVGSEE